MQSTSPAEPIRRGSRSRSTRPEIDEHRWGASGSVVGCSLVSSVFSLGRVQRARSRIRNPAGQHYSVGRRKRHFEVTLDPTPAPTNYMKKTCLFVPPPPTCHAALIANSPSHNFNYCAIFSISIYPKAN